MRLHFISLLFLLAAPSLALAQNHSSAPLMAVGNGVVITNTAPTTPSVPTVAPAEPPTPSFPSNAVTAISRTTSGQQASAPVAPVAPANPPSPASPPSVIGKLWPRDTVEVFMPTCMKFHSQLAPPCYCIISHIMTSMGHDEFLRLDAAGTMEHDPRIIGIEQQCAPQQQPKQRLY